MSWSRHDDLENSQAHGAPHCGGRVRGPATQPPPKLSRRAPSRLSAFLRERKEAERLGEHLRKEEARMKGGAAARSRAGQAGCGYWGPSLVRNLLAKSRCSVA